MSSERSPGRPRDESAAPALKAAARRLVNARGYPKVSVSELIREAGVSRQSLYRRWPTKADLVLEAFLEVAPSPEPEDEVDSRAALLTLLEAIFDHLAQDGAAIRSLIASAQEDPQFLATFREGFLIPREAFITRVLERAKAEGALPQTADLEILLTMVSGAFWYRLLNGQALDRAFARGLVAGVFGW
ncbi:TetR/AcrR family transcriptional regulator [Pseudenhygromyxa sp. WMMC2535]|uniref:TetR/AcrR family transcriptional regulator n=1 Tax=Pseudenhygromyxa sp. WMMC2535 TaxID=2712867 RepID=UPI00155589FC|nr:TetR/AcrR family transcriptional regulator [Pseudenhygromyxa sp. WMMC2535]NVB42929.1 TetR/AcrR family transcriptional regulator [Pseudenhygromyxa sp. WMMC2535]